MIHDPRTRRSVILGLGAPSVLHTRLLITYYYILVPWTTKFPSSSRLLCCLFHLGFTKLCRVFTRACVEQRVFIAVLPSDVVLWTHEVNNDGTTSFLLNPKGWMRRRVFHRKTSKDAKGQNWSFLRSTRNMEKFVVVNLIRCLTIYLWIF